MFVRHTAYKLDQNKEGKSDARRGFTDLNNYAVFDIYPDVCGGGTSEAMVMHTRNK